MPSATSAVESRSVGSWVLFGVFLLSAAQRAAHVAAQPTFDPSFAHPQLDAEYYLQWARGLAGGVGGPSGAYYLAPAYPYVLATWIALFGERLLGFLALQHVAILVGAGFLAAVARRAGGSVAGIATAVLVLFYQPTVLFASHLLGESFALLGLSAALWLVGRPGARSSVAAGAALGLATLTRPNFLLIVLAWVAGEALLRRPRSAGLLALGVAVVIAPVTLRNLVVSGHPVLVSSNGGITLFHGNGPGPLGIFNPPDGFSGSLTTQRQEATDLARLRTGMPLDDVEADGWWGRQAIRTRLEDPVGSVRLLFTRISLTVDDYEHGLDEAPSLDPNPWACLWTVPGTGGDARGPRRVSWIPFALILGLAAAGTAVVGARGSGGWRLWSAAGACALTPIVFYVSSRYRLPMAWLLAVPAGCGAAALLGGFAALSARRRGVGWAALVMCMLASFFVPFQGLRAAEEGGALTNRAVSLQRAGDLAGAERMVRRAMAVDPAAMGPHVVLGVLYERTGREPEAELEYRKVVALDPANAEAAGNLAALLTRTGRPREAVPILRNALALRPGHRVCLVNLVVALTAAGDLRGARGAMAEATQWGIQLDPELVRMVNGS